MIQTKTYMNEFVNDIFISACDVGVCVLPDDPHCGTDGTTYSNLCALKHAKCKQPALDLELAYKGECIGWYRIEICIFCNKICHVQKI